MNLDDELREALEGEADQSKPAPDGWDRLQERIGATKPRRGRVVLPALAAAVVVLAAVGAWQLTRDDVRVTTGDETTTSVGTTTPAPSASTSPGTTTATVPPATAASTTTMLIAPPTPIVAVTVDGRLVVLDAESGAEVRQLADLGDPRGGGAEGPGPNHATQLSVTPDGSTAYFDSCCEPAAGLILSVATDGTQEPEPLGPGLGPAVSPDGRLLAYTAINAVVVRDLATGEEQTFTDPAYDESPLFGDVAWSRDGTKLYYPWQRQATGGTATTSALVELTVTPGATPRVVTEVTDSYLSSPLAWDDGRTISVLLLPRQLDGSAGPHDGELLIETTSGELGQTTMGGVADRSLDAATGQLLVVYEDGRMTVDGAERATGVALAAW